MNFLGNAALGRSYKDTVNAFYDINTEGDYLELPVCAISDADFTPLFEVYLPPADARQLRGILLWHDGDGQTPDENDLHLGVGFASASITNVVAAVGKTPSGNTFLRLGKLHKKPKGWEQVAHVVLTPGERTKMVGVLADYLGI